MKTGEGKTLVATLAVYLNALEGNGVHVVTVNDYLARRDAEWMGQIYNFLGMSVGVIVPDLMDPDRRAAYAADITYGTNNEFGFDYLRDNMKLRADEMVQRPFNYAIVDEVDSILIDEARTPLIISGMSEDSSELYIAVDKLIPKLIEEDYEKDEKGRQVTLTEQGIEHVEKLLRETGLLKGEQPLRPAEHQPGASHQPGAARPQDVPPRHRLHRRPTQGRTEGHHHRRVHRPHDGRPPLVGRAAPGPRGQGRRADPAGVPDRRLHHLPELFPHVSEAGGHDRHGDDRGGGIRRHLRPRGDRDADQPALRAQGPDDEVYRTAREKNKAIIALIEECRARQQPVLVGTVSIEKSEVLSERSRSARFRTRC